jgi:hypothetical protein
MTLRRPVLSGVLDGGRYFEGPRWHLGRLWFVDCMDQTLLSWRDFPPRATFGKIRGV